jgi:NAD/NADP transhydrogenase alpha subunit
VTNIVSGFLITDRMLKMFRERKPQTAGGASADANRSARS